MPQAQPLQGSKVPRDDAASQRLQGSVQHCGCLPLQQPQPARQLVGQCDVNGAACGGLMLMQYIHFLLKQA
jgi:hypothetical protein